MGGDCASRDQVTAKLIEMGFKSGAIKKAVNAVGPSLDNAVQYILNNNTRIAMAKASTGKCNSKMILGHMRQSSILDHFQSPKQSVLASGSVTKCDFEPELDIGSAWEQKLIGVVQNHFGYSSLKNFQKHALAAWLANQDCLVVAATGSGKSLCFQIPALLTGKVVIVISPLISLMHDQCLKLSKHGISACFLGSGQPDSSIEQKAMRGIYSIVYVCPETVLRLIKPLQMLAESRGIALFAIDEVHCVSKWGHDFRPDYRRLSVLRENFSASNLKILKADIPLMALTATATIQVREDILNSLCMSKETKTVLTSFFRANLCFSVKHSRTSSSSSYDKDFSQLINIYTSQRKIGVKKEASISTAFEDRSNFFVNSSPIVADSPSSSDLDNIEDGDFNGDDDEVNSTKENGSTALKGKELSVEYLENDVDVLQTVDDCDVSCGEFNGEPPSEDVDIYRSSEIIDPPYKPEERLKLLEEPLEQGPTIIYVPTRKQTLDIAKYLCGFGVKAAAYNASLPKSHLRQVHKEFHENNLEVIVATIAFGMGIDKLNVRKIIHYGWPQSLEAYYQEAGRAGRDGKLADCVLYANLSRKPTLLPSKRSEDQTKQAYKMLADCFRYGMNTSCCRAKTLVEYFGEDFSNQKCLMCDVCIDGPPKLQNVKQEADILLQVVSAYHRNLYDDETCGHIKRQRLMEKPNLRMFVSKIREQSHKFMATDQLWWQGLARIMESKRYIREGDTKSHVQIKFPEPTELGLEFLQSESDQTFYVYPEADMLLSMRKHESYSGFSQWGKGWADPEIRRQRLDKRRQLNVNPEASRKPQKLRKPRKPRNRRSRKLNPDMNTV
ncbi:DEAD domain-containing protein/Helicase_C domain-containing protein [Cephalotus follicularis]|uniref:ATP-dependent DNA helicase n=1 Tax=Cephalotus follicularis TaxID=3775 RepID=A0A1Q3D3H3_CEPFO|nr:DEAD domain-containing protein/Helicase_C domain-containing protein [Cephalotus follicularis]